MSRFTLPVKKMISFLEHFFFRWKFIFLAGLAIFTLLMGWQATRLSVSAGFEKSLPSHHPYIDTFHAHKDTLFGANRLVVVVRAKEGTIWRPEVLTKILDVTNAVTYLPGVDRTSVSSIWTPNVFFTEITEQGFNALPITGGNITPDNLSSDTIAQIRNRVKIGGYLGSLISRNEDSAMITADLNETARNADGSNTSGIDYLALNQLLETELRQKFENPQVEIQIIGFAKAVGEISAEGARLLEFIGLALLLTALAVFLYCRSWLLTLLPLACSMTSLLWQLGTIHLLGYGLDPLAVLVPFLVFAIGVSHGVQQINAITQKVAEGKSIEQAARYSFSCLLAPGSLSLITAFASFITLVLIPIPMIIELAITAAIGVSYKVVTNLIVLPLMVSAISISPEYAEKTLRRQQQRRAWVQPLSFLYRPMNSLWVLLIAFTLLLLALLYSQNRHIGNVNPGVPELRSDARYNQDARAITQGFDLGLDWFTVVFEVKPNGPVEACARADVMSMIEDFSFVMGQVPGVISSASVIDALRASNSGLNEGQPKFLALPRENSVTAALIGGVAGQLRGTQSSDCTVQGVHLFLSDQTAPTLERVVAKVEQYRQANHLEGVNIRLASGNAGIQAAVNQEVSRAEIPMMVYVYLTILLLVLLVYRDWRGMLICCLPLTIATWLGYWFMERMDIGLTVATLPVMVLATGIGVDYAFYIYNRIQAHYAEQRVMHESVTQALLDTGVATGFTALTLSIGVSTWALSSLQFQADMGLLLGFMFVVNMLMALTVLPALAVVMDILAPDKKPRAANFH